MISEGSMDSPQKTSLIPKRTHSQGIITGKMRLFSQVIIMILLTFMDDIKTEGIIASYIESF